MLATFLTATEAACVILLLFFFTVISAAISHIWSLFLAIFATLLFSEFISSRANFMQL